MLDREPSTQNEILLHKQSSIFQLTLPYNTKKNSVFVSPINNLSNFEITK